MLLVLPVTGDRTGSSLYFELLSQLSLWSERIGVDIVKKATGADPAAVAFDAVDKALENKADVLILLSAAVGFPPFYVVSFVAGALKNHFAKFLVAGLVGRSIRFAAVVYFPQFVMRYI